MTARSTTTANTTSLRDHSRRQAQSTDPLGPAPSQDDLLLFSMFFTFPVLWKRRICAAWFCARVRRPG